jgi:hypothetical protein
VLDHRRRAVDAANQRNDAVRDRLLLDFDAFFLEHRLCGDLGGANDERAWLACIACGARIEWAVEMQQPCDPRSVRAMGPCSFCP